MATILVVDDRPTNRMFLLTLLGHSEHRMLEAADGAEALEIVRAEHPDLVITDILMPTMDGYDFVQRLRADPVLGATKVIFYTATYAVPEAHELARACGVLEVLEKPTEPQAVCEAVNRALGIAPSAPSIPGISQGEAKGEVPDLDKIGEKLAVYLADLHWVQQKLEEVAVRSKTLVAQREGLLELSGRFAERLTSMQTMSSRLTALEEMSLRLMGEQRRERIAQTFLCASIKIVGAQYAAICLLDSRGQEAEILLAEGFDGEILRSAALDPSRLPGSLLRGEPVRRTGSSAGGVADLPLDHPAVETFLGLRVTGREQVLGWVYYARRIGADEFSAEDGHIALTMVTQLALLYENASLYHVIQRHAALLQIEVTERRRNEEALEAQAKKLAQSNAELVRFNRLATGRELRMMELKREVNELAATLGRPRPYALESMEASGANARSTEPLEESPSSSEHSGVPSEKKPSP